MDYLKHYNLLVEKAENRVTEDYSEKHHIIPKCIGGSNDKSNVVELTPEEHYVAHQLLVKIYPGNHSLVFAAHMMTAGRNCNKTYGWLRRLHVEALREINTGRKITEETRIKMSISKKGKPGMRHTEETKIKIGKSSSGRTHTENTKMKISIANTGSTRTEETKGKMSLAAIGKPKSEEAKKNMRKPKQNYISKKGIPTGRKTAGSWAAGNIPWNKGKEHPCRENTKMKIKEANLGRKRFYKEDGSWIMIKAGV